MSKASLTPQDVADFMTQFHQQNRDSGGQLLNDTVAHLQQVSQTKQVGLDDAAAAKLKSKIANTTCVFCLHHKCIPPDPVPCPDGD